MLTKFFKNAVFKNAVLATMAMTIASGLSGPGLAPASAANGEIRAITFPIQAGHVDEVTWSDTYGAPRSGGRSHLGVDMCGPKMTPLVAVADGTISWMRHGAGGNNLVITDAEGWKYHYIHINNDTPGTDDGANNYDEAFAPGIERGASVTAGQPVAFMGDSGNAESTCSHLHFEIEKPDGSPINPTPSVDFALAQLSSQVSDPELGLSYPSLSAFAIDAITTLEGHSPTPAQVGEFQAKVAASGLAGALEELIGPDSTAAGIDRLYFATFGRLPDAEGFKYWIEADAGDWNIADISQFFATSDEFKAHFGDQGYEALLDQIYSEMFGRQPDQQGKNYWLGRLGDPSDPVTPGTVLSYFSDGTEAKIVAGTRSELVALSALFNDEMPSSTEIVEWQQLRQSASLSEALAEKFLG